MILQHVYIAILNGIFRITGKFSGRVRETLLFACFLVFAYIYAFSPKTGNIDGRMSLGTVLLIIMTVLSIKDRLRPIEWKRKLYIPFVLFGIGMFLISRLHSVSEGYFLYMLSLAVILPAFYLVWINRGDYEKLYIKIAVAFSLTGMIFLAYSFYAATNGDYQIYGSGRALGTTGNPNYLGMIGLTMVLSGEYLLLESKKVIGAILSGIVIGSGASMIIESISRTAMIAAVVSIIFFVVYILKRRIAEPEKHKYAVWLTVIALIFAVVLALAGLQVDDVQRHTRKVQYVEAKEESEASETSAEVSDFSLSSVLDSLGGTVAYADDISDIGDRIVPDGDVDEFSSGRVGIWQVYIDHITMFGNDINSLEDIKDEFPNGKVIRAHNNYLEYFYQFGIPVTLLYIWTVIYLGLKALSVLVNKKKTESGGFYSAVIIGTYALYTLVEISDLSYVRCVPFLFFMVIAPYFERKSSYLQY